MKSNGFAIDDGNYFPSLGVKFVLTCLDTRATSITNAERQVPGWGSFVSSLHRDEDYTSCSGVSFLDGQIWVKQTPPVCFLQHQSLTGEVNLKNTAAGTAEQQAPC